MTGQRHVSAGCPHSADVAVLFRDPDGRVWAVVADDGCWTMDPESPEGDNVWNVIAVLQQAARYAPDALVH